MEARVTNVVFSAGTDRCGRVTVAPTELFVRARRTFGPERERAEPVLVVVGHGQALEEFQLQVCTIEYTSKKLPRVLSRSH